MTMPVGYRETDAGIRVRASEAVVGPDLTSCLLAVSFAGAIGDVPSTNIAGYVLMCVLAQIFSAFVF